MTTITNPFAEEFGFVYDDANRLTAKELASGAVTYQAYDDAGRVSQVLTAKSDDTVLASSLRQPADYAGAQGGRRDACGNPTRVTAADDSYREYTYDGPNRLTSEIWRDSGGVLQDRKVYFYDEASNRSRLEQDGEPTVYYSYDARNAMTSVEPAGGTATTMEYSASGSLVKETTGADVTYYVWGADEMLDAVQMPDASWNYFSYDGDQRRWEKTDSDGTKRYRWNAGTSGKPGLAVVQEADDSDDTTAQFTHDQGVTIMPGRRSRSSVPPAPRSPHARARSPRAVGLGLADVSRGATYDLDAFGVLRGSSGAFTTPYLFTGKERDPDPGLDYFIARQYEPGRGVFASKDPWRWNRTAWYDYAGQQPLTRWDPRGLFTVAELIAIEDWGRFAEVITCLLQWATTGSVDQACYDLCDGLVDARYPWCLPDAVDLPVLPAPYPVPQPSPGPLPWPGPAPGPWLPPPGEGGDGGGGTGGPIDPGGPTDPVGPGPGHGGGAAGRGCACDPVEVLQRARAEKERLIGDIQRRAFGRLVTGGALSLVLAVLSKLLQSVDDLAEWLKALVPWLAPLVGFVMAVRLVCGVFREHAAYLNRMCELYREWQDCCRQWDLSPYPGRECDDSDWESYTNLNVRTMDELSSQSCSRKAGICG